MAAPMDVKEVLEVSSNVIKQCPHCAGGFKFSDPPDLGERINHFIKQHGYKLLHVGQETCESANGYLWQTTVAILGK
jgi:hypothetical protein